MRIDLYNVRDDVKELYKKFKGRCELFLPLDFQFYDYKQERKFYIYAWYAKTNPKRYFYVGKGTGTRYNHILNDIEKYKNGNHNLRFQRYSEINDRCGIDYEILMSGLTEFEALLSEECKKLEFLDNGEVLLNVEGIPKEFLPEGWKTYDNCNIPILEKDPIFERYFSDYTIPFFDPVDKELLLRTYFYPYYLDVFDPVVINDKKVISLWLNEIGAKIYKTVSLKTQSIIVQGALPYDRYSVFRKNNKYIFSSKEILEVIR